jgi:nucleotide-binding universal stress UspA family protein
LTLATQRERVYTDILVPTDGSDSSAAAVEQGVSIADRFGATVHFLHVVDIGVEMSASGVGTIADDLTESLQQQADEALDDAVARAETADVAYERVISEGEPHESIADYSSEHGIDLVVMGSSGRSGLKEHLLGSTADRVVRTVDTSVLLARH